MQKDNYFYKNDIEALRFYQLPKVLMESVRYKDMSLGGRLMYAVLKDRQELSIKNGWLDSIGRVFSYYTIEHLANLFDVSKTTSSKLKKELIKYKLLYEERQGLNKPNRLYVLKPIVVEAERKSNICITGTPISDSQDMQNMVTSDTDSSNTYNKETNTYIIAEANDGYVSSLQEIRDIPCKRFDIFRTVYIETFGKEPRRTKLTEFSNETIQYMLGEELVDAIREMFREAKYDPDKCTVDYMDTVGDRYL